MRLFGREIRGIAKTLVTLVFVLLVSSGLCGLQFAVLTKLPDLQGLFLVTGVLELLAMVGSAAGIIVMLIVWALSAVIHKVPQREQLTDSDQDQNESS